jgi:hypothetical protein
MIATRREFLQKMARDSAVSWMDEQIKVLKDGIKALESRKAQFIEMAPNDAPNVTDVNILSWFVNDIGNIERNMRIDLAVNHSSALALSKVTQ